MHHKLFESARNNVNNEMMMMQMKMFIAGVAVEPGRLTYIGARLTEIRRESHPYGNCTHPGESNVTRNLYELLHPVEYSQTACYNTCLQRNVMGTYNTWLCNVTCNVTCNV